jgi:hypothetical protein
VAKNVPEACVCVVSNAPELSLAVGAVHETVVPVLRKGTNMVISSGQKVTTGATLSASDTTVTSKLQSAVFPDESVHLYNTEVVCPTANWLPGTGVRMLRVGVPRLSVAVGSTQETAMDDTPKDAVRVKDWGQFDTVGGVLSTNCTVT